MSKQEYRVKYVVVENREYLMDAASQEEAADRALRRVMTEAPPGAMLTSVAPTGRPAMEA